MTSLRNSLNFSVASSSSEKLITFTATTLSFHFPYLFISKTLSRGAFMTGLNYGEKVNGQSYLVHGSE